MRRHTWCNIFAWRNVSVTGLALVYMVIFVISSVWIYRPGCKTFLPGHIVTFRLPATTENRTCLPYLQDFDRVKVNLLDQPSIGTIEIRNPAVKPGGTWKPADCHSLQKVAIIIPYRDRALHLLVLLNRLHPMLQRQKIDYRIFVVEQFGNDIYNKGRLMNSGYLEALKLDKFDCFIFHDVDLIPENDENLYFCDENARHLSPAIDEMRYHVLYGTLVGGVFAVNRENLKKINGYSNMYWGWGGEDDDLSARIWDAGLKLTRPPNHIGRYKMIRHSKSQRTPHAWELLQNWRHRWRKDGVNALTPGTYSVVSRANNKLYTNITVDVGPYDSAVIESYKGSIQQPWVCYMTAFPICVHIPMLLGKVTSLHCLEPEGTKREDDVLAKGTALRWQNGRAFAVPIPRLVIPHKVKQWHHVFGRLARGIKKTEERLISLVCLGELGPWQFCGDVDELVLGAS